MFARFFAALIAAILGVLRLPFEILGFRPRPTAESVAAAALDVAQAHPVAPASEVRADLHPVAELVRQHARARLFTHQRHDLPVPLPAPLASWIAGLSSTQLGHVIGCPSERLQKHINAGLGGSSADGPFHLPAVPAEPVRHVASKGATGGTGGPSRTTDLTEALAELGFTPQYSYRR
ncbi:hypothetical protein [Methylobacterium gossipiicola]|nr:hypothetical protein [Methylobacterium gossipiicola]